MSLSTKEYFVRETYRSVRRNGVMSAASISTVAISLLVLGMFLLIILNTNHLAQYLESQVQMTVYMEESASDEEINQVSDALKKLDGVKKVTYIDKAQALQRFRTRLQDQQDLLSALGQDNPFPASFELQVDTPERIKLLAPQVEKLPKIETAKFGQEVVENLFALTRVFRLGGVILAAFLAFATLFIIVNTIRLTVFARRREVMIMKYVGATDWFIRWPFMLEGMTLGLLGSAIACVLVSICYGTVQGKVHATLAFFPLLASWPTLLYVDVFIVACGMGIGALGSYISLRKFLKV